MSAEEKFAALGEMIRVLRIFGHPQIAFRDAAKILDMNPSDLSDWEMGRAPIDEIDVSWVAKKYHAARRGMT